MENKTLWPVRSTPHEAMLLMQPSYLRYGAASPQFSEMGAAKREWVMRDRWREFSLDEVGDMFRWYEAEIGSRDIVIDEKDRRIAALAKEIRDIKGNDLTDENTKGN